MEIFLHSAVNELKEAPRQNGTVRQPPPAAGAGRLREPRTRYGFRGGEGLASAKTVVESLWWTRTPPATTNMHSWLEERSDRLTDVPGCRTGYRGNPGPYHSACRGPGRSTDDRA